MHLAPHPLPFALAATLLLAGGPAQALPLQWFPREPGLGDTLFLVYADTCGERRPLGDVVLDLNSNNLLATLTFDTPQQICPGLPPPDAPPRLYAFEIPEMIGEMRVGRVEAVIDGVRGRDDYEHMSRPFAYGIPPSVVGTWFANSHFQQGFLITMTQRGELAVSWNTYDAEGEHLWVSGIGLTDPQSTLTYVSLVDTGGGTFAQHPGQAGPLEHWGTMALDYLGCGRLLATWTPAAYTNLHAGVAEFQQLTAPWSDPCDLAAYADAKGLTLQVIDIERRVDGVVVD